MILRYLKSYFKKTVPKLEIYNVLPSTEKNIPISIPGSRLFKSVVIFRFPVADSSKIIC
jgi:hypothetical protein